MTFSPENVAETGGRKRRPRDEARYECPVSRTPIKTTEEVTERKIGDASLDSSFPPPPGDRTSQFVAWYMSRA
jgi:hypothetical protein